MFQKPIRLTSFPPWSIVCCWTVDQELEKIYYIFIDNSFPVNVNKHKIRSFKEMAVFGFSLCPIDLKLLWLGWKSQVFSDSICLHYIRFFYCYVAGAIWH